MLAEDKAVSGELIQDQITRILRSDEFRNSEVLRRLLLYLAEKSACGEADQLKEYVIAIEGLGKPSSYDPQHSSAVRIQIGRLRQKLTEYYRDQGKDDPVRIELPKGHFRLTYQERQPEPTRVEHLVLPGSYADRETQEEVLPTRRQKGIWVRFLSGLLLATLIAVGFILFRFGGPHSKEAASKRLGQESFKPCGHRLSARADHSLFRSKTHSLLNCARIPVSITVTVL
jgi:hypothetical protein